jgi:alkaline phosphatase
MENTIAEQMLDARIDVMLGGGMRSWIPQGTVTADYAAFDGKSRRKDSRNLLEEARTAGYRVVTNADELKNANDSERLLGLFAASHMPYALDRRPGDGVNAPALPEMTNVALEILSRNDRGFFLMVEGGRIDHAAHANDVAAMLAETLEFDRVVGLVCEFARTHLRTLVLITADHATGASCMTARYSDDEEKMLYPTDENLRKIARQDASFEYMLLTLAQDISAERVTQLVREHAGVDLSAGDAAFVLQGTPISPFHLPKPEYRPLGLASLALGRVLGIHYGTSWGTGEHFAAPVLLIGYGEHAGLVSGYVENTEVFHIMKTAAGL